MVSSIKDIKDGAPTTIKEGSPTTKRQGFNQGLYNKTWQKPRRKGRDFSQHPTWVKNSRGEFLRGIKSEEIQHVFLSTHQTCRVSERFIGYPSYRTLTQEVQKHRWCCWWKKSCTTKDDDYPIIYRVLYIPGGLKCPVSWGDSHVLTTSDRSWIRHVHRTNSQSKRRPGTLGFGKRKTERFFAGLDTNLDRSLLGRI